ncbi:enoyl-CoA hydratase/isomerase family protein [Parablastomonas sp. CN1-191]|uniref:enoyl-CoA hydratase/isomerase family protein n=1 Tax=Parablastomonas sp. CN1-191 TaxID=3400908 RepID=UPI003BF89C03
MVERSDHVATITIDRPAKLNALTAAFWGDLQTALTTLADDEAIRAVILTGAGTRAFSAGGDIPGFLELASGDAIRRYQEAAMAGFRAIERAPWPVIAAVGGLALGGGCELTMACDMALAAEHARFGMPEARLGLVPGFGALRGPEVIGRAMTRYLIASGDTIDAARALAIGLVQWVVPADRLLTEAHALAQRIAAQSPNAVSVSKAMVNRTIDDAAVARSVEDVGALQASADRATGVAAFVAGRRPSFTTRSAGGRKVVT